jgi:hypothetical protein
VPESARHQAQCRDDQGEWIQARITSAIQSATGPDVIDIIMAINNWPQLYGDSVADVSDVAEEIGKAGDGSYATAKTVANDGNKWIAAPFTILGVLLTNRKSWWAEIGYNAESMSLPARNSSQRASRSVRLWDIHLATRPHSGTPTSGHGAAKKSRRMEKRSCSIPRRRSSRSNSWPAPYQEAFDESRGV